MKESVGVPMPGTVIDLLVKPGDKVEKAIDPPVALHRFDLSVANLTLCLFFIILICKLGTVKTVDINKDMKLEGDDLLLTIEETK